MSVNETRGFFTSWPDCWRLLFMESTYLIRSRPEPIKS